MISNGSNPIGWLLLCLVISRVGFNAADGPKSEKLELRLCDTSSEAAKLRLGCVRPVEAGAANRGQRQVSGGRSQPSASAGLVTKASDAIHRVLSNAFTYFDGEDELQEADKPAISPTTSIGSHIAIGSASSPTHPKPSTTKRHNIEPKEPSTADNPSEATNVGFPRPDKTVEDATKLQIDSNWVRNESTISELMALVLSALNDTQLDQVKYRQRSIRLADDDSEQAEKNSMLQLNATVEGLKLDSENVHLLCRLLHEKLLANDSNATNRVTLPTSESQPEVATITTSPKPSIVSNQTNVSPGTVLLLEDESELSQTNHESWLLESISRVGLDQVGAKSIAAANETLIRLFEAAWRTTNETRAKLEPTNSRSLAKRWDTSGDSDQNSSSESSPARESNGDKHLEPEVGHEFKLQIVDSLTRSDSNQLSLVFFLLKRVKLTGSRRNFWRVFSFEEAQKLLDKLEHLVISREFERRNLRPVILLAPFGRQNRATNATDDRQLWPPEAKKPDEQQRQISSFFDKFTPFSLKDNLFSYLILMLVLLVALALCSTIAILCRRKPRSQSARLINIRQQQEIMSSDASKSKATHNYGQGGEAIWRKLSNTTTTLLEEQDQTYRIQEAKVKSLRADQLAADTETNQRARQSRQPSEWYSFEDDKSFEEKHEKRASNGKLTDIVVVRDTKKYTGESVQTSKQPFELEHKFGLMEISATNESKNSNTLTKSELVMLKEKLVPIFSNDRQQTSDEMSPSRRQVASQTYDPFDMDSENELDLAPEQQVKPTDEPIYLNRRHLFPNSDKPIGSNVDPSKYIDNSLSSLSRKLDLPAKSQTQVNVIKGELSRIQRRDRASNNHELDQQPTSKNSGDGILV